MFDDAVGYILAVSRSLQRSNAMIFHLTGFAILNLEAPLRCKEFPKTIAFCAAISARCLSPYNVKLR